MTILPLTYLGNTSWFAELAAGDCIIDIGENYVKQTYRNRCDIATAAGSDSLTVQVVKGGSKIKKPVRDMRIDYSKRWQHQHAVTLLSAYKNSPYYDHYMERFAPFYEKRYEFLADFNIGLLETVTGALGKGFGYRISETYVEASPDDRDLRGCFPPKGPEIESENTGGIVTARHGLIQVNHALQQEEDKRSSEYSNSCDAQAPLAGHFEPYYQVFTERNGFIPNLSVIDLLFCEGPTATEIIAACRPL